MTRPFCAAGDIETLRYPSWCLCRLLDRVIGSEDVVALRRKHDAMFYYTENSILSYKVLFSGSRSEGFNFQSSDTDLMLIDQNTVVVESKYTTLSVDYRKTLLLMRRDGCKPGFVILQLLNRTGDRYIRESLVQHRGHSVVSSLLYRDAHRNPDVGQVGHGPCNASNFLVEADMAHCFKYNEWPTEANEFIYRQRTYGWPRKDLLDKILCRGCHLVPIGEKDSDLTPIQWRLSFSAAEKDLVYSFSHTQFLVYSLMKIYLKQFLNKFQYLNGILCSYFLKTAMFYCIESTPFFLWRDDLLIPCFWVCLNKLISWVEQGYCPNYFVPQNNMFRNKVFGNIQQKLLDVLNQCKHVGWTCLFLCEDLREFQIIVSYPELSRNCKLIISDEELECMLDMSVGHFTGQPFTSQEEQNSIIYPLTLLKYARTKQEEERSTLHVYSAFNDIGCKNFCTGVNSSNKDKYKTLRKRQHLLLMSSGNMGYLGMINMATFYHEIGQYQKAVCVLERVISIWKPYVLYYSKEHERFYHKELYKRYVCGQGRCLIEKVRFAFANEVIITDQIFSIAELFHDFVATGPFPFILPPLPYTAFLLFLCHHKLGNIDRSLSVLRDLEVLALRDNIQGGRQYPVVLNLLAICLDKLGNKQRAVDMCLLSQILKPEQNGAVTLLDRILSRS